MPSISRKPSLADILSAASGEARSLELELSKLRAINARLEAKVRDQECRIDGLEEQISEMQEEIADERSGF